MPPAGRLELLTLFDEKGPRSCRSAGKLAQKTTVICSMNDQITISTLSHVESSVTVGYACPTWESDINYSCKHVADYHRRLSAPGSALTHYQPCVEVATATTV